MNKIKWKAHVEACEKSGNNKRAYAEEHDLTPRNWKELFADNPIRSALYLS